MKFTDYLFEEVKEIWLGYLEHPFIKEIAAGTLPKEKFKAYLIQDYLYLKEYAKLFCIGVVKSSTMEDMKFFYNSTKGTMEDETEVHIKYLEGFGITPKEAEGYEMNLTNISYTSYMKGIALTGDLRELVLTILPCTWSYYYIGQHLLDITEGVLENNFYKEWIKSYGEEGFKVFCDQWIEYTNKLCRDLNEEEKKKLRDIFINSSIYEMKFWDMAYEENPIDE